MDKYQETWNTWNNIAELYEEVFMDLDLYNESYNAFLNLLSKPNSSILDIGCGPGNITKYLLSKKPKLKIKGIDVSEKMIKIATKNNPNEEFIIMDSRELDSIKETFDALICGFCIPYLSKFDCVKLIADCKSLLNKSGILYLSFVPGDYEKSNFITGSNNDRTYFYYHNLDFIKQELISNSIETKELQIINYKKKDGTIENHTIIIGKNI